MHYAGIDIGGTFTDLVLYDAGNGDVHVHKVRSTPSDPGQALIQGLVELTDRAGVDASDVVAVLHGTTVATNAVLEHRGARTGMITTEGFRDVVHIGRHQRPEHYSVMQDIPWQSRPFVERCHRKTVSERLIPPRGDVMRPLDEDAVRVAARELREAGVEAVAVCFLFSYLDPAHERRAAEIVREEMPDAFVTTSADVVPQFREFERFTTTSINAFVGPGTGRYLGRLSAGLDAAGIRGQVGIMRSNGGLASADAAAERPVTMLMSGPAAGVLGGAWAGSLIGRKRLITFDVGGTSADIAIVTEQGVVEASARDSQVAGFPVLVPMIDVHAIGAGGGSIARVDDVGAFRVGPQSAGAEPGPAAYGNGGDQPTVTDAHVALGRLDPDRFLGGRMQLDRDAALAVIERLAGEMEMDADAAAEGVLALVNATMAQAIRSRTVQKGHDPREFALVAFGGAGPLHAAEVAAELEIPEVIVPPHPGITSATGLLTSDLRYDGMRTVFASERDIDFGDLGRRLDELEEELRGGLRRDGVRDGDMRVERALDCRYRGQGYELRVPLGASGVDAEAFATFHRLHRMEYGREFAVPIEVVNMRITVSGARSKLERVPAGSGDLGAAVLDRRPAVFRVDGELRAMETVIVDRANLSPGNQVDGPAIFVQEDTTTVVPPGWRARTEDNGVLVLTSIANGG
ncbi:hydantoinase/oxoprolinase family protein [Capillimicrobium parvum]|uniref:Acetophenone carboxylase gamma subunit n=1 Tax=Capillimicrobium parvum TaxID=2884022 RepID=A0A9E6XUA9_9ACTN|nr:hydantoinase/oxoprolinase family protein [Capillimicrobium parvum]UGS34526.1 Acetophenone carboxylase gamma subunit [Capillimicrobium parvum]